MWSTKFFYVNVFPSEFQIVYHHPGISQILETVLPEKKVRDDTATAIMTYEQVFLNNKEACQISYLNFQTLWPIEYQWTMGIKKDLRDKHIGLIN